MASGTGEKRAYLRSSWLGAHRPCNSDNLDCDGGGSVRACECACINACMRDVLAIYDNIISPRLVIIIIKTIILYFIQITHL